MVLTPHPATPGSRVSTGSLAADQALSESSIRPPQVKLLSPAIPSGTVSMCGGPSHRIFWWKYSEPLASHTEDGHGGPQHPRFPSLRPPGGTFSSIIQLREAWVLWAPSRCPQRAPEPLGGLSTCCQSGYPTFLFPYPSAYRCPLSLTKADVSGRSPLSHQGTWCCLNSPPPLGHSWPSPSTRGLLTLLRTGLVHVHLHSAVRFQDSVSHTAPQIWNLSPPASHQSRISTEASLSWPPEGSTWNHFCAEGFIPSVGVFCQLSSSTLDPSCQGAA